MKIFIEMFGHTGPPKHHMVTEFCKTMKAMNRATDYKFLTGWLLCYLYTALGFPPKRRGEAVQ